MKKLLTVLTILTVAITTEAQNIQVLNGVSSDKSYTNWATFELYKTQPHGALFYFTDFKMSTDGYWESYTEISKYWKISESGFSTTIQYNVGLNKDYLIKPVYLLGVSKEFAAGDDFIISLDLLYRYQTEILLDDEWPHGYQATLIFSKSFEKLQLSGYCDYWNLKYFIFEPQIWYPLYKDIYAGLEGRLSNYSLLENYCTYIMAGLKFNL